MSTREAMARLKALGVEVRGVPRTGELVVVRPNGTRVRFQNPARKLKEAVPQLVKAVREWEALRASRPR